MSDANSAMTIKVTTPQSMSVPLLNLAPFEEFTMRQKLSEPETQRFFNFIELIGGDLETDLSTLSFLYHLWTGLNKSSN